MPLITSQRGVLVDKYEKQFADGTRGFYCTIVTEERALKSFWCPESEEHFIGEAQEVEEYRPDLARDFRLRAKEWNGKTKYTLVSAE